MRKTTLLSLLFLLSVSFSASIAQNSSFKSTQDLKNNKPVQSKVNQIPGIGVALNQENQNFYNQTGVVKCITDEINAQHTSPEARQRFEDWLAPLVQEYKQNIAQQKATGNFVQATYNIPIIFHVVSGSASDAANLSQAQINAQIDQLNIDFANLAGADGGFWDGRDADSDIQFVPAAVDPSGSPLAEPGINRVFGYPGTLGQADFENNIKPATQWDRTMYANIWTGNLSGGLLGYAQFPDNSTLPGMPAGSGGAVNTDGVVCLFSSIGSTAMPYPGGAPYNQGRTLTHEIGHWIGLRHIWGDGGCGADDFCADTPNAGGSNFGCPTVDSCTTDADRDMVENYMDYTDDSCMDIFTTDQVARMIVVLQNSPGRTELPNSTTGDSGPVISFASSLTNVIEGSDCSFTDFTIDLNIGDAPSNNATVNLSVTGGTATNLEDFELLTPTVNFAAGSTAPQTVTLRIFNDSFGEGNENATIEFTVNANGGDATAGNSVFTLTIEDDDVDPLFGGAPVTIASDDFESGFGNWTVTGAPSATNFALATNATIADAGFFNTDESNTTTYAYVNDDDCNCDMSNERMAYNNSIDLAGISNASISLDYAFSDTYGGIASVQLSTDGGATWPNAAILANTGTGDESNIPFATVNIDLSAFAGQVVNLSVHYNDEAGWAGGLVVDNFEVSAPGPADIQTAVNAGTSEDQINLIGSGEAYGLDTISDNAILNVNVLDGFSYDCTTVAVSRAGTSAQPFNGSIAPALVTDKAYTITPSADSAVGSTQISFYFSEAELAGWEAATGDSRANLQIGKDNGASLETVSATITAFGSDWKVTGNFASGLNGTYYFGNMAFLSTEDFTFDSFVMYPNPSNGSLTIGFNTSNDVNVNLYDIRGRSVLNKNFNASGSKFNQTLNLASLATGVYVVKINSGSNTMFRKLIVN
ncbi:T9SS type A sorting domain-containing protein [Aurantibacter aestuarii]|nr:T9SS type A sorting domain-containing protein [Aurantibacter aestuarii]